MKWILVIWSFIPGPGGDPGIIQGYVAPRQRVEIIMPSKEICLQIKELNKYQDGECWQKAE